MNKSGYQSFDKILKNGMRALDATGFESIAKATGALILDTRSDKDFFKAFIPQSVNIGLGGDFAPWVGALLVDVKQAILLVTEPGREEEAITRLSRVGFDNVQGHLLGGFDTWAVAGKEIDTINRITPAEFAARVKTGKHNIVDIRKESEYEAGHVIGAVNKPLAYFNDWFADLNSYDHFYLHCAGGYRSMIAASILQARGYRNFSEIEGGFNAVAKTNVPRAEKNA